MTTDPVLLSRARAMRRQPTDAERALWSILRNRALGGAKFRRQAPVGPFIADFLCEEAALVVEADGGRHADMRSDRARTLELERLGYRVLRFWNNDVLNNGSGVAAAIVEALQTPHPPVR